MNDGRTAWAWAGRPSCSAGAWRGLCAAGALAPHFDEVLVLERDELPADAEHRRGVPQSKHPHFLLNSGRRAISELFPGFEEDLIAAGGLHLMPSMDAAYLEGAGWASRKQSSMTMVYSSRILIERVLRDKVRAAGQRHHPRGSLGAAGSRRPARAAPARGPGDRGRLLDGRGGDERIDADLVVDAMGRGSSVSDWLVAAGWPETAGADARRQGHLHLAVVRPAGSERPPRSWWWQHLVIMPTQDKGEHPAEHEFLVNFFPIEGNRTIACMGSWGIDMPRTADDFVALGRTAADAAVRCGHGGVRADLRGPPDALDRQQVAALRPDARRPPLGIVFIGDAICAFNPFYAQGISSAAGSALTAAVHLGCRPTDSSSTSGSSSVPRRATQGAQGAVGPGDGARPRLRVRHRHRDPAAVAAPDLSPRWPGRRST